jgi:hypothetical protein
VHRREQAIGLPGGEARRRRQVHAPQVRPVPERGIVRQPENSGELRLSSRSQTRLQEGCISISKS